MNLINSLSNEAVFGSLYLTLEEFEEFDRRNGDTAPGNAIENKRKLARASKYAASVVSIEFSPT